MQRVAKPNIVVNEKVVDSRVLEAFFVRSGVVANLFLSVCSFIERNSSQEVSDSVKMGILCLRIGWLGTRCYVETPSLVRKYGNNCRVQTVDDVFFSLTMDMDANMIEQQPRHRCRHRRFLNSMPCMVRPLKRLPFAFRGENFMSIAWLWIVGRCGGVDTTNMETLGTLTR